ncbi:TIGR00730 family Rossman fold protein [Benzoatithermus flavus]|uniref:Cytokinin riboside 5'-monophosphate phosphoribohydrolase n=1 Tax=Benzoatithermus flavus TaxID=3108223 RepID=A0ABU8XP84_9PROT
MASAFGSGAGSSGAVFSVGVFCGSRPGSNPVYAAAAETLGTGLGRRSWRLVYGGGDVGLMGTVARSAMAAGATVLGVIPQRLLDREVGKRDITELHVTRNMFDRKEQLIDESDAFVALPGGLGTLDEILDAVTLRQLGYHDKPILLVDIDGFWRRVRVVLEHFVAEAFADASVLALCELVPDVPGTLARLEGIARGR